jgi:hypothetical protein
VNSYSRSGERAREQLVTAESAESAEECHRGVKSHHGGRTVFFFLFVDRMAPDWRSAVATGSAIRGEPVVALEDDHGTHSAPGG